MWSARLRVRAVLPAGPVRSRLAVEAARPDRGDHFPPRQLLPDERAVLPLPVRVRHLLQHEPFPRMGEVEAAAKAARRGRRKARTFLIPAVLAKARGATHLALNLMKHRTPFR